MIWIVCALLTIALIALGVKSFLSKSGNVFDTALGLLCLLAATYVVYIPPFSATYGVYSGMLGNLVHTIGVMMVDADIMDFFAVVTEGIGNDVLAHGYLVLQVLLHVAVPAVSALTAVTVLFRCFSSVELHFANKRKRPLFIFSELNERSVQLAKSLDQVNCDVVFASSAAESLSNESKGRHRYLAKEESISEIGIHSRKGKDIYFFCISEDEDLSLDHTLQLIEKYNMLDESEQEHIHIYQFSKHRDYAVFIDSVNKGALDVQCVNEYERLVYSLLDSYPLFKYAKPDIHVLLHGLSDINIVALRAMAWCGQLSGFTTKISVVGIDIADRVEQLKIEAPGLFEDRYCIRFYDCKNNKELTDTICENCADASYILVSGDTDNQTMDTGILLRRLFYRLGGTFDQCPPVFCYIKSLAKYNIVKQLATAESNPKRKMSYDLTPFGSLESVFTYQKLVDDDMEKIAQNVHLAYEEIFSDGEIDVKSALKNYNVFEVNKRSNRANALHIRYKLNLMGLDYTDDPLAEEVRMEDFYTDEWMDKLAYSEHDRWMAFLETEGWTTATKEEVEAYRASGISKGRHNCPILKMHPYICAYEALKALSEELEGKDTTVYDKELILRIPDILGNKWNVANKKYKIIKMRE